MCNHLIVIVAFFLQCAIIAPRQWEWEREREHTQFNSNNNITNYLNNYAVHLIHLICSCCERTCARARVSRFFFSFRIRFFLVPFFALFVLYTLVSIADHTICVGLFMCVPHTKFSENSVARLEGLRTIFRCVRNFPTAIYVHTQCVSAVCMLLLVIMSK